MNSAIEFAQEGQNKPLEGVENFVGKRVEYQDEIGTVKYSGPLKHGTAKQDTNQIWLGIQWDNPERGRHNGVVEGYEYFRCDDEFNSGSLLKLDKANFGVSIYDGIHARYFNNPTQSSTSAKHEIQVDSKGISVEFDEEAYFETVKKFKKKVEFIGFDKIWAKINDLKNIRELSLPRCKISDIGPDGSLKALLPSLKVLSIESNLLYDWNQVFLIGRELKGLEELSISGNKLPKLEDDVRNIKEIKINSNDTTIQEAPLNVFANLQRIVLISMDFTWKKISKILPMFLNVKDLILCYNRLNDFENLTLSGENFKNLEFLNLEGNEIKSFEGVLKFNNAPKLSKLILSKNEMSSLGKITGFESVRTIIIEENNITSYLIFSQLNQFPRLETLRITKNPISSKAQNVLHVRQRAIAEIKNLKSINGGELKKYERKDCEIYYLRNTFHEFFTSSGQNGDEYIIEEFNKYCETDHPRIPELMKMYGNPYDEGIKNKQKAEAAKPKVANLISIKLNCFSGPGLGKPASVKKFTDNTLITNLKAMLAKQFAIPATKQKIYFKADPHDPFVQMDEDLKDLRFYGVKQGHEIWVGDTEI